METIFIKRSAQDILRILKPIALALDRVQSENALLGDALEIWFELSWKCPDEYQSILANSKTDPNEVRIKIHDQILTFITWQYYAIFEIGIFSGNGKHRTQNWKFVREMNRKDKHRLREAAVHY